MLKKKVLILIIICISCIFFACMFSSARERSIKDFDQNMLDLRIYHENLGDALLAKNKDYAAWFVNDMDSILRLMTIEFPTYRKLEKPFKYHYEKRLAPYLSGLKTEIKKDNWKDAISTYSLLTRKCNGCHTDHDIDKEVRDVTQQ